MAKRNPLNSAKLLEEEKMRRGEGEGPQVKISQKGEMAGAQRIFFKFFLKNDLRFSRSLGKKGAESKNKPLLPDIYSSHFARSLPRCDPNFSHTKVAILGGI